MPNFSVPNSINPGDALDANKAMANWNQVVNDLNGAKIDATNIVPTGLTAVALADAAKLGLSDGTSVRRGKFIQAASGTRTNAAYGALSNGPDVVTSIVLPTDGLIAVAYSAIWQESVNNTAKAAIFIGANQLKIQDTSLGPIAQEAAVGNTSASATPLASAGFGLVGTDSNLVSSGVAEITTGQVVGMNDDVTNGRGAVGGPCFVFAAAGTYDVSVQFKASSGTVSVQNRHLWVWTVGF